MKTSKTRTPLVRSESNHAVGCRNNTDRSVASVKCKETPELSSTKGFMLNGSAMFKTPVLWQHEAGESKCVQGPMVVRNTDRSNIFTVDDETTSGFLAVFAGNNSIEFNANASPFPCDTPRDDSELRRKVFPVRKSSQLVHLLHNVSQFDDEHVKKRWLS